ncbi:MAG: HNH endonuclease, partial [Deltaproteobacteria bacterium]
MSEVRPTEAASDLDAIAAEAWALELPSSRRRGLRCHEAAVQVERLLTRFARGRGALDVAIGEGLLALGIGDRALRLGYCGIGDYARERLGIAASTAQKMARLARELRGRPLLREAVWTGEVTARQAETVLPVARGEDEASWVARARSGETVRALKAAVKTATGAEPEQDEAWERISVPVSPEARPVVDKALELAGKILGATAPKWQRIEAICNEYLGAHGQPDDAAGAGVLYGPVEDGLEPLMEYLEQQTAQWAFLEHTDPVLAPVAGAAETDPLLLDAELRRLAGLRAQWDDAFGHLAMLMRTLGLWRDAGFASFGHYCSERLGMTERTVEQRIALERRLRVLPALRQAMREGRIS